MQVQLTSRKKTSFTENYSISKEAQQHLYIQIKVFSDKSSFSDWCSNSYSIVWAVFLKD